MVACSPTSSDYVATQNVEAVGGGQGNTAKKQRAKQQYWRDKKTGEAQRSASHLAVLKEGIQGDMLIKEFWIFLLIFYY